MPVQFGASFEHFDAFGEMPYHFAEDADRIVESADVRIDAVGRILGAFDAEHIFTAARICGSRAFLTR